MRICSRLASHPLGHATFPSITAYRDSDEIVQLWISGLFGKRLFMHRNSCTDMYRTCANIVVNSLTVTGKGRTRYLRKQVWRQNFSIVNHRSSTWNNHHIILFVWSLWNTSMVRLWPSQGVKWMQRLWKERAMRFGGHFVYCTPGVWCLWYPSPKCHDYWSQGSPTHWLRLGRRMWTN